MEHCYTEAIFALGVAAVTDILDGYVARKYKQSTSFGSVLDPMADKVLMSTLVVSLASVNLVPSEIIFIR